MKYKIYDVATEIQIFEQPHGKGTRTKDTGMVKENQLKCIIKYQKYDGNTCIIDNKTVKMSKTSEAASEKMAYEISKLLGIKHAKIELCKHEEKIGIISYIIQKEHESLIEFRNLLYPEDKKEDKDDKLIFNFGNIIEKMKILFEDDFREIDNFVRMIMFDCLVGESDRHSENFAIIKNQITGKNSFSPLYDSACNLCRDLKDENNLNNFVSKHKSFDAYIIRSKTKLYNADGKIFKQFDLFKEVVDKFPKIAGDFINRLKDIDNKQFNDIISKVDDFIITKEHKSYIYEFLCKRKEIMINIFEGNR